MEARYDDVGAPRLSRQQLANAGLRGADADGHWNDLGPFLLSHINRVTVAAAAIRLL